MARGLPECRKADYTWGSGGEKRVRRKTKRIPSYAHFASWLAASLPSVGGRVLHLLAVRATEIPIEMQISLLARESSRSEKDANEDTGRRANNLLVLAEFCLQPKEPQQADI